MRTITDEQLELLEGQLNRALVRGSNSMTVVPEHIAGLLNRLRIANEGVYFACSDHHETTMTAKRKAEAALIKRGELL